MKVSVLQENFVAALRVVQKCVNSNPPLPILANMLLEAKDSRLYISGTDLVESVSASIGAKIEEPGTITLPAKTLNEIVRSLSKERIDMTLDSATWTMHIRCGIQTTNMRGIDAEEFPPIKHGEKKTVQVEGDTFASMVREVAYAVAREQNRPILTGVYLRIEGDTMTLAAADGYRLAARTATINYAGDMRDAVVPVKTMVSVGRAVQEGDMLDICFPEGLGSITFGLPALQISGQLLEGRFPDYGSIIPKATNNNITAYREDFLRVAQRAQLFARDNANSGDIIVRRPINPGEAAECELIGKSSEQGGTTGLLDVMVDMADPEFAASFNVKYIIDIMRSMTDERVVIGFTKAEEPGVIRGEGRDNLTCVLMPMSGG